MTQTSKTILFFGTEDFSLASLQALVEAGFSVGGVITKPDARRGRSGKDTAPKVKTYALEHDIAVLQPTTTDELIDFIAMFNQPAAVLVSYGRIIPQRVINLFTPGIINVHPSLLPHYRGPTPIESAIINGDKATGVSIMQLDARMDAGAVYSQTHHPLQGNETKPSLYTALAQEGAQELVRVLPVILDGSLLPTPQDDDSATYCALLSKEQTSVQPVEYTAEELERRIRAHLGFPKTRLPFYEQARIITKAHTTTAPDETTITCKDGSLLAIDELVSPAGKTVAVADFLHGLRA
ncbi:MAG: methionyl-tRNA formyltransferase [Candidatus Saccharimonadales bacterium]